MEKEYVRACSTCQAIELDGEIVPAGEYLSSDFNLSHGGGLSKRCFNIAYGDNFPVSENLPERCATPSEKIGDILYIPKKDIVLPDGFFDIVAPGYEVKILDGPLSYPSLLEDLAEGLDLKVAISTGAFDSIFDGVCPNVSEYSDTIDLVRKFNFLLAPSREAHYQKHFG